MNVKFSVKKWAAWAPGVETREQWCEWAAGLRQAGTDGTPEVKAVPAMLRRRLDRVGRAALHVACECLEDRLDVPLLFASRNGETPRSVRLLEQLAGSEPLSPTDFGLSVHNATGGLFTIARQENTDCTALAAGRETLPHALLEAVLHLQEHEQVLLVLSDEVLPQAYQAYADERQQCFACALLLEAEGREGLQLSLTLRPAAAVPAHGGDEWAWPLQMVRWLCSDVPRLELAAQTRCWSMERASHAT